jgi:sterol desaturase/sphingolipid hydroxylase (fatty acid hydroxylase superfamily)
VSAGLAPALAGHRPIEGSFEQYKREQARIARKKLWPLTGFYGIYSLLVILLALWSRHPLVGLSFYLAGILVWTLVEYLFHRYVLHGRFPPGEGLIRRFMHERLDPLHWEHHERPFDGLHISGALKDILPLFFVAAPFSLLFPVYTLSALLAGVVLGYVGEEWIHYFLHFGKSRNGLFRHLKRYHLYHHSPRGIKEGYGITSGFWDIVFHTQYPRPIRKSLFEGARNGVRGRKMTRSEASRLFAERFQKR